MSAGHDHLSEGAMRSLLENLSEGVVYQERSGTIISANPAAAQLLGAPLDQLIGRSPAALQGRAIDDEGRELAPEQFPSMVALRTGKPQQGDLVMVDPQTDRRRKLHLRALPEFLQGQSSPSRVLTIIDEASEPDPASAGTEALPSSVRDPVVDVDYDLAFLALNAAAERLLRRSHNDVEARPVFETFSEAHRTVFADGSRRHSARLEAMRAQAARHMSILIERLVTSEEMLTATGRMARVGGWKYDVASNRLTWTTVTREIHEVADDYEPRIEQAFSFFHPGDREVLEEAFEAAVTRGEAYDLELRFMTGKGKHLVAHTRCEPILREDRVVQLVGTFQDVTERVRAGRKLMANERLLRLITDNMFDMVSLADLDLLCTYASPSHAQLGYARGALEGRPITEYVHELDRGRVVAALSELLTSVESKKAEYRFLRADGSSAWLESFGRLILDEGGNPVGVIVSSRDITERRRAEQELASSEQRFRMLFENSLAPILITSAQGDVVDVNEAACGLFGYERGRLQQMRAADLVPGVGEDAVHDPQAEDAGTEAQGEHAFTRPDGDERVVVWAAAALPNGQRASVLRDITEAKRNETRLREEKERAQQYLDVVAVMLLGTDRDGKVTLINRRGCEILGVQSPAEVLGETWFQYLPEDWREAGRAVHRALMAGQIEPHRRVEGRVVTAAGGVRTLVWHNAVVRDPSGRIAGSLSSGEDVTERRQMEAQLAQTDRLSSMGSLAAAIAHEINNPLSFVLYNIESLNEDLARLLEAVRLLQAHVSMSGGSKPLSPELERAARFASAQTLDDIRARFLDALEGSRRIQDVTKDLNTFSRVEPHGSELLQVETVIEAACRMARNEIKYRARLVKRFGSTPPVEASEGKLSQVVLNLLINAAHAIDEGNRQHNEIRIRTWTESESVFFEVSDTGKGIAPEHMARLFDPFFSTKKVGVGSGLGLAISKNIVESYGGTIFARSELGQGASFVIRLPRSVDKGSKDAANEQKKRTEPLRGRILVVDDEAGVRSTVARILRAHETVLAVGGAEAMRMLESDRDFDLIVCDVMMADVSGMDLHRWIASAYPQLAERFIFITGGAFTPRAREYLHDVDVPRVEKPFDIKVLRDLVHDMLRRVRSSHTD